MLKQPSPVSVVWAMAAKHPRCTLSLRHTQEFRMMSVARAGKLKTARISHVGKIIKAFGYSALLQVLGYRRYYEILKKNAAHI